MSARSRHGSPDYESPYRIVPLGGGSVQVGPHAYEPIRKKRWWRRRDIRCRACFVHRDLHPVAGWVESRPWGDLSSPSAYASTRLKLAAPIL